jgi:Pentapeptide repeats (8 copies)
MGASGPGNGLEPNGPPKGWRNDTLTARAQLITALCTLGALIVAIVVAWQSKQTVDQNSQVTLLQSEDTQLSTAITAIGSADPAEQVAGLLLLTQNTTSRITNIKKSGEPPADVYNDYLTSIQILSGYLSSHSQAYLAGVSTAAFGRGYGPPPSLFPLAIHYAADQLNILLAKNMQSEVTALQPGMRPSIDLSTDELYQQYWFGINFSWVTADMPGIDLRGAELGSSQWSPYSTLDHSDLQCANLSGANFRGVDLDSADLNGAYVQGADFRGADLKGATIQVVYGNATWSQLPAGIKVISAGKFHPSECLNNPSFWNGQSAVTTSPAASSSAVAGSSPTSVPSAGT